MDSKEDQKCKDKEEANPRRYAKRRNQTMCVRTEYMAMHRPGATADRALRRRTRRGFLFRCGDQYARCVGKNMNPG